MRQSISVIFDAVWEVRMLFGLVVPPCGLAYRYRRFGGSSMLLSTITDMATVRIFVVVSNKVKVDGMYT
jgi:hypothetical protein